MSAATFHRPSHTLHIKPSESGELIVCARLSSAAAPQKQPSSSTGYGMYCLPSLGYMWAGRLLHRGGGPEPAALLSSREENGGLPGEEIPLLH